MDDSDESPYQPDDSDNASPSWRDPKPRPQTPEYKNASESVASDPPSTLRRSKRHIMPVRRLDPAAVARPASSQLPRGGPRLGSHDHTVQALLKLPGFCFTRTNNVFNARDGAHLATILGAQFEPAGNHRKAFPASSQRLVCVRVANVIEACCDEWLEDWQGEALTSDFWAEAAERLRCYNKHWAAANPTPIQVNTICMAYTGHWDPNGRGGAPDDDEASWGFELGELTWGKAKADIDPNLFAKPWDETETNVGPIQNAVGARNHDRNRPPNRRRGGRSLVAPSQAPEGFRPRAVAMNEPHQFFLGDEGDPVIVYGPRRANNEKVERDVVGRVKATIDRSDPKRLLVTFSGLVFKGKGGGEESQESQQGDEGKDVHSMYGSRQASEDVTLRSNTEEMEFEVGTLIKKATVQIQLLQDLSFESSSYKMCPPADQAPAVLGQADAATMPLPYSNSDSPDVVSKNNDDSKSDSVIKSDEAHDALAPLPSETEAPVTASGTGGLATIKEQIDPTSPSDELATVRNTTSESKAKESIDFSDEGGDELNNGSSKGLASASTDNAADDPAKSEDHKFVDPNDKDNIGNDVIKFFYTSSTRKRPSSPVATAPGCCNPRLHRDSDLYIKAKGEDGKAYVFEVVSATLEKASPKFEAMIYGSHTRGNKEEWVWELDDSPLGLKIMFCLLHNKFPRALVASKPNPNQLYKVLQVLEKYEVNLEDTNYHLFAPSWIDGFKNGLVASKLSTVEALQVAYKLGDFKTTKILIREAAHEISDEDGKRLQDFPIQQREILDSIENIRNESLKNLLDALRSPLEYFMDASNLHGNQYCKSSEGHFECNQKLLGSLMANLVQQSLFPIPETANYKGSVAAMIDKIEKMEIRGLFYPGVVMTEQKHTLCKLGQAAAVEEAKGKDEKATLPLSDHLLEYMYFACKRNGLLRKELKEFEPYKDRVHDFELLYRDEFKKDIWGWHDHEASEGDPACDGSDDSSIFDVVDGRV
ncbi:hypothetical protein INS49_008704 [Diaporthe citri]|uniref:uncharacterized protein n=1 Tax=Diaporthe citri TaxID=83186 RepID=UPI001C7E66C2|nr:uncharacterized protein INS49_008704 [Diaporthe citri]KAG6363603.1 hypothetical protein INS49_008704 [Diaporthe citri]